MRNEKKAKDRAPATSEQTFVVDSIFDCKIKQEDVSKRMALRVLRGTIIFRSFVADRGDSAVALRSAHHCHQFSTAHQNLLGRLKAKQQQNIH